MTPSPALRAACRGATAATQLLASALAAAADAPVEKVSVRAVAHFDFNGAGIRPADRAAILAEVGAMKDVTWQTVTATAYTDSVGSAGYNERLSVQRALGVKRYLVGKGLDRSMIDAVGKGEAEPVADNASADGRAQNRRATIEFQGVRTAAR